MTKLVQKETRSDLDTRLIAQEALLDSRERTVFSMSGVWLIRYSGGKEKKGNVTLYLTNIEINSQICIRLDPIRKRKPNSKLREKV